jgi:hypothetical protein
MDGSIERVLTPDAAQRTEPMEFQGLEQVDNSVRDRMAGRHG